MGGGQSNRLEFHFPFSVIWVSGVDKMTFIYTVTEPHADSTYKYKSPWKKKGDRKKTLKFFFSTVDERDPHVNLLKKRPPHLHVQKIINQILRNQTPESSLMK